jgi:hypothetical protein
MTVRKPPAADGSTEITLADLAGDDSNPRKHGTRNLAVMEDSLRAVGAARSIVINGAGAVLAGNGIVQAAARAGISKVRIIDTDGDTLIAVRRRGLTPAQERDLKYFDNRAGELAEWDPEQVAADVATGLDLRPFWSPEEEAALLSRGAVDEVFRMAGADVPGEEPAAVTTGDYQTFSCPLTTEQERTVRAALRQARQVYSVTTAGDALALALQQWVRDHGGADGAHQ